MRPNPAELAEWTRANARARMAYDADKQAVTGPACAICGGPRLKNLHTCDQCVSPTARAQRRYRANKNGTQP